MYTVKIQRIDWTATETDVALPFFIEDVGHLERATLAREFADMWKRHDSVGAVWIERQDWVN